MRDKVEIFERMPVPRAVLRLSVPPMFSSLVMILYNLADAYFVGKLNDPIQSASVTLAAPVMLAFCAVTNLFGAGSASVMSRALGSKDSQTARQSAVFGFYCALAGSLLFSLGCGFFEGPLLGLLGADETTRAATAAYLRWTVLFGAVPSILSTVLGCLIRAEGAALHASVGTMSGCALNILLDPIFVLPWGLGLGAAGAGLATMLSNCLACLCFAAYLLLRRKDTCIRLHPKYFCPRRGIVLGVCGVGIPAAIQNLLNVTGMVVLNQLVSAYSAEAISAMGICNRINALPVDMAIGFNEGMMPLVGYNYASGDHKRMGEVIAFSGKLLTTVMVLVAAVFFLTPGTFVSLFMDNQQVVTYGTGLLRGFAIALPFLRIDYFTVGVMQAIGMGREVFFFAVARKLLLQIPAMLLLDRLFPLYGLAYAQLAAEVVMAAAAILLLRRFWPAGVPSD